MLGFKSFLLEYLTDAQKRNYSHVEMSPKARQDTDRFFGVGNDKVHGEIHHDDKSEIHKQLENHLGQSISNDDYKRGTVKDKYGRDMKIGRLIKDNHIRNQYDKDPVRQTDYTPSFKTSTVRGVEVAGQTNPVPNAEHPKGHSWKDISCKNVVDGVKKSSLENEIKHGTVVHFVHDKNGQEIYRATLQPYHNEWDHTVYGVDSEYGVKHPAFTKDAHRVAKELSGEYKSGIYTKNKKVHDDNGVTWTVHPAIQASHIDRVINNGNELETIGAVTHPHATDDHVRRALKHDSEYVRDVAQKVAEKRGIKA